MDKYRTAYSTPCLSDAACTCRKTVKTYRCLLTDAVINMIIKVKKNISVSLPYPYKIMWGVKF
jgi:hypothetical protein